MNSRSPAGMTWYLTWRTSAMRTAVPSGSRRAALMKLGAPSLRRSTETSTGLPKWMIMIGQVRLTRAGTGRSNLKTMRAKPWSVLVVTLPGSMSARAGAQASAAASSRNTGSRTRAQPPRARCRARA